MPVPNEGTAALASDSGSRYYLSWYNAADGFYYAPRADNAAAKNLRVALYDATGVAYGAVTNPLFVRDELGTFSYGATTLTAGTFTPTGRVAGLRVYAHSADGAFRINGGDVITVREGTGFDWTPRTPCVSPTITWVSGTLDVFVELAS